MCRMLNILEDCYGRGELTYMLNRCLAKPFGRSFRIKYHCYMSFSDIVNPQPQFTEYKQSTSTICQKVNCPGTNDLVDLFSSLSSRKC